MFSDIPKLFDRNFAVGFVIPTAAWLIVSLWMLTDFGYVEYLKPIANYLPDLKEEVGSRGLALSLVAALTFAFSLLLLLTNNMVYRTLEGYCTIFGEDGWMKRREIKRYRKCLSRSKQHPEYLREFVQTFPHEEKFVLPTAFGNSIRAFEVYSFVIYGVEAIGGWERLSAVMPESQTQSVNSDKANVDFWLNSWFLSLLLCLEYLIVLPVFLTDIYNSRSPVFWTPIVFGLMTCLFSLMARNAAIEWGEGVKASFDLYLPDLAKQLGIELSGDIEKDRAAWEAFGEVYLHRDVEWREHFLTLTQRKTEEPEKSLWRKLMSLFKN